jgi:hypothetical protein
VKRILCVMLVGVFLLTIAGIAYAETRRYRCDKCKVVTWRESRPGWERCPKGGYRHWYLDDM